MTAALGIMSLVASGVQAVGQVQAANQQAGALEQQAYNAELQANSQAAQYEQQAASQMQQVHQYQARARAGAAATGMDPFSGGVLRLQEEAGEAGGRDVTQSLTNAKVAISAGTLQAGQFNQAAGQAQTGGFLNALGTVGGALMNFSQLGGAPSGFTQGQTIGGGAGGLKGGKELSAAAGGQQFNQMFSGGPQPYKNRTLLGG